MPRRFRSIRSLNDDTREQLDLAAAVATEAVQDAHVRFALDLLDEGGDRVPVERLLDAYARLLHLTDEQQRQLTDRVFGALGRDPDAARGTRLQARGSVIHRAATRLRGRVHPGLRVWLDRHAARAALSVLDLHVEHALRYVVILLDQRTPEEAAGMYAETMGLRPTEAEMVRLRVLARAPLSGEREGEQGDAARETTVERLHPRTPRPFRLAKDGS